MAYPTIEQYQTALQHPNTAFTDPLLAGGKIRASNLGLPLVASGGFALTYALETAGKKLAVRCFHREAKDIERRYAAISKKLSALSSPYFVEFEFQEKGFKLNQAQYPLVKMAWAEGETLGQFVESNYQNKAKLTNLIAALSQLSAYLESQGIAHGDIQEGNLMVADSGHKIQLIDYDGIFVQEIAALGGSELGHRDYQHPGRSAVHFGPKLDRFSLIVLNLSLRALCANPGLWPASQSGAGVIVFRANDFADPWQANILAAIAGIPELAQDAQHFMAICAADFSAIPSLTDFVGRRNIPKVQTRIASGTPVPPIGYISQYPVLNAIDYNAFHQHIGSMVELVGKIVEVSEKRTQHGRPYIFVNFAPWKGKAVKISLWSTALHGEKNPPAASWAGRWVTIRGLVEPVYSSQRYGYDHISITATAVSQISQLTETEAKYRLAVLPRPAVTASTNNGAALAALQSTRAGAAGSNKPVTITPASVVRPGTGASVPQHTAPTPAIGPSNNQAALQRLRQASATTSSAAPPSALHHKPPVQVSSRPSNVSMQARHSGTRPQKRTGLIGWLIELFT